ncbi:MAG: hypothetical protein Q7R98_02635 [Candidatus Jorgensenbacteria bacterium]|nr:hypothetical protein [Candidatus Jorgensenbacteria bacterium]
MKILICASKHNYCYVTKIKNELEVMGHIITVPNSYDEPMKEEEIKNLGIEEHRKWKGNMIRLQKEKVDANDCVLVLNFEKNGQPNYIGGATFLEIFRAFDSGKKAYLYNPIPESNFKDELIGMGVEVINGDLHKVI